MEPDRETAVSFAMKPEAENDQICYLVVRYAEDTKDTALQVLPISLGISANVESREGK